MAKQILMPENEFNELLDGARRRGRNDFARELAEDFYRYAFPGQEYNSHESLDTLWPRFLIRVKEALQAQSREEPTK
jgi:hypothetical protein